MWFVSTTFFRGDKSDRLLRFIFRLPVLDLLFGCSGPFGERRAKCGLGPHFAWVGLLLEQVVAFYVGHLKVEDVGYCGGYVD
jgi:hypothetical protein